MSSFRVMAVAMIVAAGLAFQVRGAAADGDGSFTSIASLVHDYTSIPHSDGTVVGGTSQGTSTVIESSGGPFVAGEHSQVTCVVLAWRSDAGLDLEAPCTMTAAEGDELYLVSRRRAGDVEEGTSGGGSIELMGGTGMFAGVTGACAYETDYLANDRLVTWMDCDWHWSSGED